MQLAVDALDAAMADLALTQQGLNVAAGGFDALEQRLIHVNLHQEVHAAAQIEAQIHRQGTNAGQPVGRVAQQVQRHDVIGRGLVRIERVAQDVARLELGVGVGKAGSHRAAIKQNLGRLDVGLLKDALHPIQHVDIHLDCGAAAGDLYRRRLAKEIGQGVEQAEYEGDDHHRVFPDGVSIHYGESRWDGGQVSTAGNA